MADFVRRELGLVSLGVYAGPRSPEELSQRTLAGTNQHLAYHVLNFPQFFLEIYQYDINDRKPGAAQMDSRAA
jgi:hypothetical protein